MRVKTPLPEGSDGSADEGDGDEGDEGEDTPPYMGEETPLSLVEWRRKLVRSARSLGNEPWMRRVPTARGCEGSETPLWWGDGSSARPKRVLPQCVRREGGVFLNT